MTTPITPPGVPFGWNRLAFWKSPLLCLLLGVASSAAWAIDAPATPDSAKARAAVPPVKPKETAARFGVVLRVSGDVSLQKGQDKKGRTVEIGDIVYVGERIHTGPSGEAVVKTEDAGMIGARPNSDFYADEFVATGGDSDSMALRLTRGSLRVITGWIGRLKPKNYRVTTPTATIGVRGTDHEPYVLSAEAASGTPYKAGSYDKVNQGTTYISAAGAELDINAGQVGVAPEIANSGIKTRGLMTLGLPYLLDHVPDFYRGGKFEDDLDAYSKTADQTSRERYQQLQGAAPPSESCVPLDIARAWIERFDDALQRRDAKAILSQFGDDATVRLSVRDGSGALVTNTLSRAEFAKSSAAATAGLEDFSQTRETLDADRVPGQSPSECQRIYVDSLVTEQGRMNGRPYRIQSREEYVLERRDDRWLAIHASSTQR